MRVQRFALAAVTLVALAYAHRPSLGQDSYQRTNHAAQPAFGHTPYVTETQQRLGAAEERIRQLESRLSEQGQPQFSTASTEYSAAATNSTLVERVNDLERRLTFGGKSDSDGKSSGVTMKITGRIHADYWGLPTNSPLANAYETGDPLANPPDRFLFRRARIGFQGDIHDTMLYKFEFDLAEPNDPRFKDMYLGWKELPFNQVVLLGQQKRPYGLDHLNSSRYNVFMERPFIVEAINEDARRVGLAAYGYSDNLRWNWRYGGYLLEDLQSTADYTSNAYQMEFAGRLANTIWYDESSDGRGYAHWAVAGTLANPNANPDGNADNQARFRTRPEARTSERWFDTSEIANADNYQVLALEGVLNLGALSIVAEYQSAWVQRNIGRDLRFDGGYVYVAYWLTGEHTPWERESGTIERTKPFENFFLVDRCTGGHSTGWGAWQVAARVSRGDFTDNDIFGGVGDALTLGLNWWWTPNSRLQFNYVHGNIRQGRTALDNADPPNVVFPAGDSGNYDIFGVRFMVDF